MDLVEGTYRLTRDVKNSKPDRRVSRGNLYQWFFWPDWKEDELFVIDCRRGTWRVYPRGGPRATASMDEHDPRFLLLFDALEPIKEATDDYLIRRYGDRASAGWVALEVLKRTRLVNADLLSMLDRIDDDPEDGEAA